MDNSTSTSTQHSTAQNQPIPSVHHISSLPSSTTSSTSTLTNENINESTTSESNNGLAPDLLSINGSSTSTLPNTNTNTNTINRNVCNRCIQQQQQQQQDPSNINQVATTSRNRNRNRYREKYYDAKIRTDGVPTTGTPLNPTFTFGHWDPEAFEACKRKVGL
ncbi:hypothetical protein HDU76_007205 [Blyttiomyces sp. JEL0837]|nr:hypothetical protein HDU76_007205 [Blyttiomyces sp. JEL0837]